ncbi:hypothetical protein NAEGRDRAFT_54768 [Naegleria gruberi]|uniref:Uncharacterized protein n=1 Tax=Naegleria gruberi TaxID=5762 RepID=D2W5A3_NAEGR|nr:uncharacterized protein NAEGRDRAFT_54768 [Naegleria gruberi]EFC35749.1 hypothetical protein NAEGRDRAFT_54768 [Naegleria gruberi]|eukprot:XP_002668493.1 hypothetical protein NAEGRDRAFT_54768 [Naegleria gruberi strain NEG-M]
MNNHETVLCEGTLDMFDAPSFTSINISSNSSSSPSSNSPSLVFHLSTSSDFQTSEQTKQSSSGKRSKSKAKKRKVILDEDDERDYEECDFILEKGVYSYAPKYQCWTDISSEVKQVYRVVWDMFAKCARSIINDHLEMRNTSRVHHLTLGSCLPTVFYLILKETNGVFNQWFQVVKKHGIKVKEECIQFRFKNCLPCLDKSPLLYSPFLYQPATSPISSLQHNTTSQIPIHITSPNYVVSPSPTPILQHIIPTSNHVRYFQQRVNIGQHETTTTPTSNFQQRVNIQHVTTPFNNTSPISNTQRLNLTQDSNVDVLSTQSSFLPSSFLENSEPTPQESNKRAASSELGSPKKKAPKKALENIDYSLEYGEMDFSQFVEKDHPSTFIKNNGNVYSVMNMKQLSLTVDPAYTLLAAQSYMSNFPNSKFITTSRQSANSSEVLDTFEEMIESELEKYSDCFDQEEHDNQIGT